MASLLFKTPAIRNGVTIENKMINRQPYYPFLIILFAQLTLQAQEKYRAIPLDVEQGLSLGGITSMLKDDSGFLWIGTETFLNRFDGRRVTNYVPDKTRAGSIGGTIIYGMVQDSLNNIWIATSNGLSRYDNRADTFSNFHNTINANEIYPSGIPISVFRKILPFWASRDEVFCVEMLSRITAYNCHSLKKRTVLADFHTDFGNDILKHFCLAIDEDENNLWLPGKDGLREISLRTGKEVHYNLPCFKKSAPQHLDFIATMRYDAKRKVIWLNTTDGLVQFRIPDRSFIVSEYCTKFVNKLHHWALPGLGIDTTGNVWFATTEGIFVYTPNTDCVTRLSNSEIEKEVDVDRRYIYCDRDGIVWIGNWSSKIIYQFNPYAKSVTRYVADRIKPYSLSHKFVSSMLQGPAGKIWIGTWDGLNIFDPATGKFEVLREKDLPGLKGKNIIPVAIDTTQYRAWIKVWPPSNMYLMDIRTKKCTLLTVYDTTANHRLSLDIVSELVQPFKNGILFPITGEGIFSIKKDSLVAHEEINIRSNIVRMVVIRDSLLFVKLPSTGINRTYYFKDNLWNLISTPLDSINWTSILFDSKDQSYWVGGLGQLIHYDKEFEIIQRYTKSNGFPGLDAETLLQDASGNIWFEHSKKNISRLNPRTGKFITLSEKDGFNTIQKYRLYHRVLKDDGGNLYFAGIEGIDRINPLMVMDNYPSAKVYLESININEDNFWSAGNVNNLQLLSVRHNENNIRIRAGIIDYYSEGRGHIRYKLENLNNNWQYETNEFTMNFDGLRPGKYKLIMQASNAIDEFNGPEKILWIYVRTPFWSTWWFKGLAVICSILVIYGLIRWRLNQKFHSKLIASQKDKQLAELQQQKTELEMQALRAQMNPHFIFNSLNSINRFILQNNKAQASEYLTKFSKLVRMILQNSQASLITLEGELESLELYLNLEALRFNYQFDYKICVPRELDISSLKVPPLILQPFVENAIWHGLMHKEDKGQLDIEVSEEDNFLNFKIIDNGIGREKAAELASKSVSKHKSMGLRITAHRIAIVQSSQTLTSPVTVNDLVNADGTAAGTEVIIKMPVIYD